MARKCSICSHKQAQAINKALLKGEPFRHIAAQYGTSTGALQRHKNEHLPVKLVKAQEAAEVAQADNLLDQLKELQAKAWELLSKAEKAGDLRTALAGVREAKGCLELLAKLQGELAQEGAINITLAPEWIELRALILQAVDPFPEARQNILEAIRRADPC
jgi:hypothetical protein